MPAVAELLELGELHRMRVSIPEISAVSWTSFATGANPGIHGIFGFVDLKPGSYEVRYPSFADCRARTIWERVGSAGGSSVVINQPFTYPVRPMSGSLIAGFVALDLERATHPPELLPKLREAGYRIDIDSPACRADRERLWRELDETLESRRRAVEMLWGGGWDYFEAVVTGTDRLHHFAWDQLTDPGAEDFGQATAYYSNVDRFVGEIWRRFRKEEGEGAIERFLLLSDHGFCGIEQEVYLNRWLQEEGYLDFDSPEPESLEEIAEGSRAFCLDPGRIFINSKARFPGGTVDEKDVPSLAAEINDKLSQLRREGREVVRKVFTRDEVYAGPQAARSADLVALGHRGFDLKGRLLPRSAGVFGRSGLTGMHTWDDAFALSGAELDEPLMIWDLAGKLEAILGLER